ncbi:MAG: hypothetical protein JW891_08210 [Candidatus Lokiarchaeota archaeon]|nr:hypothetical protein [Candidatus Lokiarchaeota archaeon]
MDLRLELLHKYPWLPSLGEYYSELSEKKPSEFLKELFSRYPPNEVKTRLVSIFKAGFKNAEQLSTYKIDELNTYIYLAIKFLLVALNDKILTNRIANLYSKINYEILKEDNYANIYTLCQDLKLDLQYSVKPYNYGINIVKDMKQTLQTNIKLHFSDYLALSVNFRDDPRKLVNNPLEAGYVYVEKRSIARLLQEHIRKKILSSGNLDKNSNEDLKNDLLSVKEFQELHEQLANEWDKRKEAREFKDFSFGEGKASSEFFPPCLQEILTKAKEGQNLVHNERLFMVFLLHAINYKLDEIVNIFSNLPDFDESKTRYQVDFALEKNYTPHKCDTLKSLHFCKAKEYDDELCLKGYYSKQADQQKFISHPLTYITIKQYRNAKSESKDVDKFNQEENKE